jgi:hypothetical protein
MNNTIRILTVLIILASAVLLVLLLISPQEKTEPVNTDIVLKYEFVQLPAMTPEDLYVYTVYLNAFQDNGSTYFNAAFKLGGSECGAMKLQNNGSNLILDCQTTDSTLNNGISPFKVTGAIQNLSKGSYNLSIQRQKVVILETDFEVK